MAVSQPDFRSHVRSADRNAFDLRSPVRRSKVRSVASDHYTAVGFGGPPEIAAKMVLAFGGSMAVEQRRVLLDDLEQILCPLN